MTASRKLTLVSALLISSALSGCGDMPTGTEGSAINRLKEPAGDHARALAGDDVNAMRKSGFVVLSLLEAYAGW